MLAYPAPGLCQLMFAAEQKSRSSCIAKAIIYLLGRGGGGEGGVAAMAGGAEPSADPGVHAWCPVCL